MDNPTSTDPRREFRGVAGRFASGVAVVIAMADGGPHATTASSFVAVSAEPPLIAVFFATAARMHGLMSRGVRFTVSILQEADHDLARRFARPNRPMGWPGLDGVELRRRDPDLPVLSHAIAWLDCAVSEVVPMGDHGCFVGEVRAMGRSPAGEPLVYYRGRLHRLGPPAAPSAWSTLDRTDLAADW